MSFLASQLEHLLGLVLAIPTEEWGPSLNDNPYIILTLRLVSAQSPVIC